MNKIVGVRIKRAREGAGLTQEALAEMVDRTKEAISNIERGINLPSLDTLQRICETVSMPISSILEDSNRSKLFIDVKAQIDAVLTTMEEDDLRFCLSLVKLVAQR
ncbi:helix-turn-helix transcriptional regulator [Methylobacterium sp. BTF04]|uniref:helix-turn-helix transcriptional regulator n=1 Tax=Methylobacterium sp. BTF04 TaxID=2708300 RepID=UPI0013D7ECE2|nr:helix-turn-helix transcriptional regulator [Methylobacterium sp. BTF04]NEU11560.1 helix-turn-helix transcriptional regulator [Methylobacterium sp. BTF04]